jgi:hypothetical protein
MRSSKKTISLYVDNSNFLWNYLTVFHFSAPSENPNYRPIDNPISLPPIFEGSAAYYEESVTLTKIVDDANSTTFTSFPPVKLKDNTLSGMIGLNIVLKNRVNVIEISTTSLFDLLETVWGIATVCFAVLLAKVAKYINSRVRTRKENSVKTEFRDNLGILLSKVSSLRHGRQRR